MSLINLFKEFHRDAIQQEFPPSTRVLFDTLLYKFNEAFWTDKLVLSERELISLTGLPKTTVNDAKRFLAARRIIKITPFKNKTAYSLGDEWAKLAPTTNRPVTDRSPTTNRPAADRFGGLSITHVREDVKTLDNLSVGLSAGAENFSEVDTLLEYWDGELKGGRLTFEHQSQISAWLAQHGFEWVKAAMREASDANGNRHGLNFKLLRGVVERKANPPLRIVKGGEKRASNPQKQGYAYASAPEYDIDFESD